MSDVTGPISTLPGSIHIVPNGMKCDTHGDALAVKRIQGATDSFGSEMMDMCQACYDEHVEHIKNADTSGKCDWCGNHAGKLIPRRDFEEGMAGRVYDICQSCIDKENKRLREELDYDDDNYY